MQITQMIEAVQKKLKIQVDGKRVGTEPLPDVVVHFREPTGQSVRVPIEVRRE